MYFLHEFNLKEKISFNFLQDEKLYDLPRLKAKIVNKKLNTPELNKIIDGLFKVEKNFSTLKSNTFLGGPVLIEKGMIGGLNRAPNSI